MFVVVFFVYIYAVNRFAIMNNIFFSCVSMVFILYGILFNSALHIGLFVAVIENCS